MHVLHVSGAFDSGSVDAGQIRLHGGGIAGFERIGHEGVTNGDFRHMGHGEQKRREVGLVQIVPGIDLQARSVGRACSGGIAGQFGLQACAVATCVGCKWLRICA